ncbi:DUF177 domain-containing protein [candidate division KSB1 bacterium]|nr:DUF177 domain-containing protein [candidate division KSB1 bacterium]
MKISLIGLAEGLHSLHFEEEPENCGIVAHPNLTNRIQIDVDLERRASRLILRNTINTVGRFTCDRCLTEFDRTIVDTGRVVFTSDEELLAFSEDEVHVLEKDAREIDVTNDIRDLVLLAVPAKILCSEDCKGLCPHCGVNLNEETCLCGVRPLDPRWQALQKLFN